MKFLSTFRIWSHNSFLFFSILSIFALMRDCLRTSSRSISFKSLLRLTMFYRPSSSSINRIVMPKIYVKSVNPNFWNLLPRFIRDHYIISFSLNIFEVFFWLLWSSVSRMCILLFSTWYTLQKYISSSCAWSNGRAMLQKCITNFESSLKMRFACFVASSLNLASFD